MMSQKITSMLRPAKILFLGDFMLDVYTIGHVNRLSPEAPVPLLSVEEESCRPGGGGNAILNLLSLKMEVKAIGRVGDDQAGHTFLEKMRESGISHEGIFVEKNFKTPVKKRMIADNQQLLRVDYEIVKALQEETENRVKEYIKSAIADVSIVAISDYGKGFFTPSLLRYVIDLAKKIKKPLIVDPKGRDFSKYQGATLIKPNFLEAVAASGLSPDYGINEIARKILDHVSIETLMVTRGREGISLFWKSGDEAHFPVKIHKVFDVTGAGDTVLSVITVIMANQVDLKEGAFLANVAASIAIEYLGCAPVTIEQIVKRCESQKWEIEGAI